MHLRCVLVSAQLPRALECVAHMPIHIGAADTAHALADTTPVLADITLTLANITYITTSEICEKGGGQREGGWGRRGGGK